MLRARRELEEGATALGVRADMLERVDRLVEALRRIETHEALANRYALKGGTALNLFWLAPPRLSVDIDVNFIGEVERAHLASVREDFVAHRSPANAPMEADPRAAAAGLARPR